MNQSSSSNRNLRTDMHKESVTPKFIHAAHVGDVFFIDGEAVSELVFDLAIYGSDPVEGDDDGWRAMKPFKEQLQHEARMRNWNLQMAGGYDPYNNHPAIA